MEKNKKTVSHKVVNVVSGIFLIISIIVFVLLIFWGQYQDLKETYATAEEANTFIETECQKYDNYAAGISANSKQDLLDTANVLRKFVPSSKLKDDQYLNDFIRTEHLGGIIILDNKLSLVAQADMDNKDSYSMWKEIIQKQGIKDILRNSEKKYIDHVVIDDTPYDFAVISNDGKGLFLCYSCTQKPSTDPYEFSINNLLVNNSFHKNPTVIIANKTKILSTNDKRLEGKKIEDCDITDAATIKWKKNQLTCFKYDNTTWYGTRRIYSTYSIYVIYPSNEVFSIRTNFITIGFLIYMAVDVIILWIERHFDKINLNKAQKRLRIINAINTTYSSTALLHLDRMQLEPIKISDRLHTIYEKEKKPQKFLQDVYEQYADTTQTESIMEFLDINTMAERLKNQVYLGKEVCDKNGTWYSLLLIPQRYDEANNVQAVLAVTRDITTIKEAEELSFRDKLTGLYNRNYMEMRSRENINAKDFPVTLIMADCNYLKRTNDTLGHEYGDLLLQRVAEILGETIPENCEVMRIGGDEFLIMGKNFSSERAAQFVAETKEKLVQKSDDTLTLSVSFGIHTTGEGEFSFKEAYEYADQAMYEEKQKHHKGMKF